MYIVHRDNLHGEYLLIRKIIVKVSFACRHRLPGQIIQLEDNMPAGSQWNKKILK
jgi:hypothetical protein